MNRNESSTPFLKLLGREGIISALEAFGILGKHGKPLSNSPLSVTYKWTNRGAFPDEQFTESGTVEAVELTGWGRDGKDGKLTFKSGKTILFSSILKMVKPDSN